MASASAKFTQHLGARLSERLEGRFRFLKSRSELRADAPNGQDVLILHVSAKYSPHVSVAFYFGRNFTRVKDLEKRFGLYQFPCHIQQFSLSRKAMSGLPYDGPFQWSVDITRPPETLTDEIAAAVEGVADPFFRRYSSLDVAREALAANDPWCFGGPAFWRQLLHVDLALGDLAHFEEWSKALSAFDKAQADQVIEEYCKKAAAAA